MSAARTRCPHCQGAVALPEKVLTRSVLCPHCRQTFLCRQPISTAAKPPLDPRPTTAEGETSPSTSSPALIPFAIEEPAASRRRLVLTGAGLASAVFVIGLVIWLAFRSYSRQPRSRTAFEEEFRGVAATEVRDRLGSPASINLGEDWDQWKYQGLTRNPHNGQLDSWVILRIARQRVVGFDYP